MNEIRASKRQRPTGASPRLHSSCCCPHLLEQPLTLSTASRKKVQS
jgi:hypothetical protein